MEYKILRNERWRESTKEGAYEIAKFIKEKKIKVIVALERSGRPAGLLVRDIYKQLYPKDRLPKTFFLNPDCLGGNENVEKENTHLYNYILGHQEEPIAILDEYCSSGTTMKNAKNSLTHSGSKKVYCTTLGCASDLNKTNNFLDIRGGKYIPQWYLGNEKMNKLGKKEIKKYSDEKRNENESVQLRKEFKQLAKEIRDEHSKSKLEGILEKTFGILLSLVGITILLSNKSILSGNMISLGINTLNFQSFFSFSLIFAGFFLIFKSIKIRKK